MSLADTLISESTKAARPRSKWNWGSTTEDERILYLLSDEYTLYVHQADSGGVVREGSDVDALMAGTHILLYILVNIIILKNINI